ncbi:MAG: FAD-binding protein [Phycisphaerae bacterium]|nr:FAD-binding protein [Gemmatimonadaceae bacterium]
MVPRRTRPAEMMDGSTASLVDWVQADSEPFRIVGNGTWLGAGRQVHATRQLSLHGVTGIVEYVPGDLTMTVRAGTSHAELDEITRREGQWIGLDPVMCAGGTIGATVATASVGPLVHSIGAVRDIVLGVETVSGNGVVSRGGGKVVKNVAGYDLVRLHTGAYGTLGIITEVSLRLRALPEVDETVALELDARTPLAAHLVRLRNLTLSPLAIELLGAGLAEQLGLSSCVHLVVRLGGNEPRVKAQRELLSSLGIVHSIPGAFWHAVNVFEGALGPAALAVARVSHLPSQLANSWAHVHAEISSVWEHPFFVRATVSRGNVRVVIPNASALRQEEFAAALTTIAQSITPPGGHVVWEQLPANAWPTVPSGVADRLSYGLQRTFDPDHRCNPDILGTPWKQ